MKRNLVIIFIILLPLFSLAQEEVDWGVPYNKEKEAIIYEEVVSASGTKDELYDRSLAWISTYFTAGANKITSKNKAEGKIELKDRLIFYKMKKKTKVKDMIIDYNLTIWLKDGRFKYEITNFRAFQGSTSPHIEQWMQARYSDPETAKERFAKLNTEMLKLTASMKEEIAKAAAKENDDW
jgi:hypothetical protein